MLKTWKKLGAFSRFFIISFICTLLVFAYTYAFELNFAYWKTKEENYDALEDIMYKVIEEKNFTIPLTDKLSNYNIYVDKKGDINIELYSDHVEYLYITLDSDFNLIELDRQNTIWVIVLAQITVFAFGGILLSLLLYIIYYLIKYIIKFIKFIIRKLH